MRLLPKAKLKPRTSAAEHGVLDALFIEMPDLPPRTLQFDLRPDKEQVLSVCGKAIASFQLVGMILYAKDYHYIADVRDPRDGVEYAQPCKAAEKTHSEATGRANQRPRNGAPLRFRSRHNDSTEER